MLLKIVYLLTCRVLGLAVLVFRGDLAKDAELLVLRHAAGIDPVPLEYSIEQLTCAVASRLDAVMVG